MGKYHQSKYEQEVTIGFNAAEGTAEIYTADPVWIRKMDETFGYHYPCDSVGGDGR